MSCLHRLASLRCSCWRALTAFASVESIDASRSVGDAAGALPLLLVRTGSSCWCCWERGWSLPPFVASWRLPALAAAIITKGAFLVSAPDAAVLEAGLLLLLLVAAVVLGREAWQEARWDRMLPLRSEG